MTDHNIQLVLMLVNSGTLAVIAIYTWETIRLRKAAWEQVESLAKPCLTLRSRLRDAADAILSTEGAVGNTEVHPENAAFVAKNIGNGIALNVKYFFRRSAHEGGAESHVRYIMAIQPGQCVEMPEPINVSKYSGECELVFQYESISGRQYESVTGMNHHVLTHFRAIAISSARHRF